MDSSSYNENPLVTFALFAYNQEKYIREAVAGAFAQSYSPLEIILSDDHSMDSTFAIMQEMAKKYVGPHRVRLNQTLKNNGVVHHAFSVALLSSADYLVVAAGDDISKPERTSEIIKMFKNTNVFGVCSGYDVIDENSVVVDKRCLPPKYHEMANYFKLPEGVSYKVLQGSTSAYRKSIFFDLKDIETGYAEDNFLNFVIYANGGVVEQTPKSLVFYRRHGGAVHHKVKVKQKVQDEERISLAHMNFAIKRIKGFKSFIKQASAAKFINKDALDEDLRRCEIIYSWKDLNFFSRSNSILNEIIFHKSLFLKWQMARLFGKFPNYQPKIFLTKK